MSETNKSKSVKPFRAKPNSIVAIRYKPPPASCANFTKEAWVDPMPGRDMHYNLIGKYIRCMFPKNHDHGANDDDDDNNNSNDKKERILEGEIIATNYYINESNLSNDINLSNESNHNSDKRNGFQVQLLIDKEYMHKMPFLKQFLVHEHSHSISSDTCSSTFSKSEQRKRLYEEQIRGRDKVIVTIVLADIISSPTSSRKKKNQNKCNHHTIRGPIKWVIRKWIPVLKNNTHHHDIIIGNKYDDTIQRQQNYKWLSSLQYYYQGTSSIPHHHHHHHHHYTIGEVIKIELNHDTIQNIHDLYNNNHNHNNHNNNSYSSNTSKHDKKKMQKRNLMTSSSSSLATVTIKKMILPELTFNGRLANHHPNEIFDLYHNNNNISSSGDDGSTDMNVIIQVPIEDLIVIGRKVHRIEIHNNENDVIDKLSIGHDDFFLRYKYSTKDNFFQPASTHDDFNNHTNVIVCHYCRRKGNNNVLMRQCLHLHHNITNNHHNDNINKNSNSSWWCDECCQSFSDHRITIIQNEKEWIGPCCLGICDCFHCKCQPLHLKIKKSFGDFVREWVLDTEGGGGGEGGAKRRRCSSPKVGMDSSFCRSCGYLIITGVDGKYDDVSKKLYTSCSKCSRKMHCSCLKWEESLRRMNLIMKMKGEMNRKSIGNDKKEKVEESIVSLTCFSCSRHVEKKTVSDTVKKNDHDSQDDESTTATTTTATTTSTESSKLSLITLTKRLLDAAPPYDFDFELPFHFLEKQNINDNYQNKSKSAKRQKRQKKIDQSVSLMKKKQTSHPDELLQSQNNNCTASDSKTLKSTCARCVPIHTILKSGMRQSNNSAVHARQSMTSLRNDGRNSDTSEINTMKSQNKMSSSRATRAKQRRRNKEFEELGIEQAENMAGKEDVLRFGKSFTHGWGVFTDGYINAGDLIVEYRGILIGNTVADKREKEYEKAKIGSDYMFRIDSETVCDATRHGNVARFINASCSPNCMTQIITINGSKRIAIYAKRDIMPGEELCYDYKFEPEFDESKRIPCNCGTAECRGFMNWNKKYVAIKTPSDHLA